MSSGVLKMKEEEKDLKNGEKRLEFKIIRGASGKR